MIYDGCFRQDIKLRLIIYFIVHIFG